MAQIRMSVLKAITSGWGGQLMDPVLRGRFTMETHEKSLQICYIYQKYKATCKV